MRKILAIILSMLLTFSVAVTVNAQVDFEYSEDDYPDGIPDNVLHNTELLYELMKTLTDQYLYKSNYLFAADIMARNDIIIANIQLKTTFENKYVLLLVIDTNGIQYDVQMSIEGGLDSIFGTDGVRIFCAVDGETPTDEEGPTLKWYEKLWNWLKYYIFFGWIWMK